jgi:hypothetical protein
MSLSLALGLLPTALEGAPKPTPTPRPSCTTCPIVYTQTGSQGRADLMLMQADGSQKTLLLAGARNVAHNNPVWAPDGEWIAFQSNRDGQVGIWLVKRDGPGSNNINLKKAISPCDASNFLHFASWRPVPVAGPFWFAYRDQCGEAGSNPDIFAVKIDPASAAPAISDSFCLTCEMNVMNHDFWTQPAWTSDGLHFSARMLPGTSEEYDAELVIFDFVDGNAPSLDDPRTLNVANLGIDARSVRDGVWAHGRDTLVVRSVDSSDFWLLDIDHEAVEMISGAENLTAASYGDWSFFDPRWSSDDSRVIFTARSSSSWGLFVSALPPSPFLIPAKPIAPSDSKAQAMFPDWNPTP